MMEATAVNEDPAFLASPDLHGYDAIVLNYLDWKSPDPGEEARKNLKNFIEEGITMKSPVSRRAWPGRSLDKPHEPAQDQDSGFRAIQHLDRCLRLTTRTRVAL